MATIVNARDVLLQAASPRVIPTLIPIDQVEGLLPALKGLQITATADTFTGTTGTTSPSTITLTATRLNGVTGSVTWSLLLGTATLSPSGDTCVITGSTMSTANITVRARVTETDGVTTTNYDRQINITKLGTLAGQGTVNLATQITGQLANTNVNGLGALALLPNVNLSNNVQVIGTLAVDRLGVGTLAAGVVYAGTVHVDNLVGTIISGKNVSGGNYLLLGSSSTVTAPVRFNLITDSVPANGANGFIRGNFEAESLSGNLTLNINNSIANLNANTGTASLTAPRSGGGTNLVQTSTSGVLISGDVTLTSNDLTLNASTLYIAASSFGGSLGNKIILKGAVYTVKINGGPADTTVQFV